MIIKPRIRGFICTTAHPTGCAAHVHEQIDYVRAQTAADGNFGPPPKRVLVLGCSAGYGLASRIVSAYGAGASTIGLSFEREPEERKPGSGGWYNNQAFDRAAADAGLYAKTFNADAFADATKAEIAATIKADLGQIDLLVYSLASPVRQDPDTGITYRNTIKPLGDPVNIKTLHVDRGVVHDVEVEPATEEELAGTIKVMGGEDWQRWVNMLQEQDLLAPGFKTTSYTYIGSELTWPIYWRATLGKAKEDLDRAAGEMRSTLTTVQGDARVAVLKAVVTQAAAAIPVVPLYASILLQVMKEQSVHEDPIAHIDRLFRSQLYSADDAHEMNLDEEQRIRVDDLELLDSVQSEVRRRWDIVTTENVEELADLAGYRREFLKIFGFDVDGVDYAADVDPMFPA